MSTTRDYTIHIDCYLCGEEEDSDLLRQIDEDGEKFAHDECIADRVADAAIARAEARRDA